MDSSNKSKWTSLSVERSVLQRLESFCDTYDIVGNNDGIEMLLTLVDSIGVPVNERGIDESVPKGPNGSPLEVKGFLLGDGEAGVTFLGRGTEEATVITDVGEPAGAAQPMNRTQITEANVYCPACGDIILEYELSSLYPGVKSGVFESLTVTCGTCGSERPHYTLFVSQPEKTISERVLKKVVQEYFAYVLIIESMTPETFSNRVKACKSVATDGEWEWLPDPSEWIGFETSDTDPVTENLYCEFLKSYLTHLLVETTDPKVMGFEVKSPDESDRYFSEEWELHLETRNGDPMLGVNELSELTDTWESVTFDVMEVDADTFASDTIVITLSGLQDV